MSAFKTEKVKMIQTVCLAFSIENTFEEDVSQFSYAYKTETSIDELNKYVHVFLEVIIKANLKKKQEEAGSFQFGFTYEVENLAELLLVKEDKQVLDDTLLLSVLGISFSTARGMIVTKAAGTVLAEAYLPIVNPRALITLGK